MICRRCHGKGQINRYHDMERVGYATHICPDCDGMGILHCCDGLTECPEQDREQESEQDEKDSLL
jgi:DnaJ-class molecular chaperone